MVSYLPVWLHRLLLWSLLEPGLPWGMFLILLCEVTNRIKLIYVTTWLCHSLASSFSWQSFSPFSISTPVPMWSSFIHSSSDIRMDSSNIRKLYWSFWHDVGDWNGMHGNGMVCTFKQTWNTYSNISLSMLLIWCDDWKLQYYNDFWWLTSVTVLSDYYWPTFLWDDFIYYS